MVSELNSSAQLFMSEKDFTVYTVCVCVWTSAIQIHKLYNNTSVNKEENMLNHLALSFWKIYSIVNNKIRKCILMRNSEYAEKALQCQLILLDVSGWLGPFPQFHEELVFKMAAENQMSSFVLFDSNSCIELGVISAVIWVCVWLGWI